MRLAVIFVAALFGLFLHSCGNEDVKYSCDESVDSWVKDHIQEIQGMTRADWLESDPELSIPMYRAFTPDQKISFWRDKFEEVKQLPWSAKEIAHIGELEKFFESHLSLFNDGKLSDSQLDEVEVFLYKWKEKAEEELGWTQDVVFSIVASGDKVLNTRGEYDHFKPSISGDTKKDDCNCNLGSWFTCSPYVECLKRSCKDTNQGCGGLFLWDCNGMCEEPG